MKPWSNEKFVGIEIECYTLMCDEQINKAVEKFKLTKYVDVDQDGSIHPPNPPDHAYHEIESHDTDGEAYCVTCDKIIHTYLDYEFKVLVPQRFLKPVLMRLHMFLKHIEAKVNETCGLHVHLDMRKRDHYDAFSNLVLASPLLYKMNPIRRKSNRYCIPNILPDWHAELS